MSKLGVPFKVGHQNFVVLAANDIVVNTTECGGCQRPLSGKHVKNIVEKFEPSLADSPLIRSNRGQWETVDGQHTLVAWQQKYRPDQPLLCRITTLPPHKAFLLHAQGKKPVSPAQQFKTNLAGGEPYAVAVNQIALDYGWAIRTNDDGYPIPDSALHNLGRVQQEKGSACTKTVFSLASSDGGMVWLQARFVLALLILMKKRNTTLRHKLNKLRQLNLPRLIERAGELSKGSGGGMGAALATLIEQSIY